jgi:hypothetical protein
MLVTDDQIISTIENAAIAGVRDYETNLREGLYHFPEHLIEHRIYTDLAAIGMTVVVQATFEFLFPAQIKTNIKYDLAAFDITAEGQRGKLRAVLEIKGPCSNWGQFTEDFDRLQRAKDARTSALITGFVYVTEEKKSYQLDAEERKMKALLNKAVIKISPRQRSQYNDGGVWESMSYFETTQGIG